MERCGSGMYVVKAVSATRYSAGIVRGIGFTFLLCAGSLGYCDTNIDLLVNGEVIGRSIVVVTEIDEIRPNAPLVFDVITKPDCEALIAVADFNTIVFSFSGDQVARVMSASSKLATWKVGAPGLPKIGFDQMDPVGAYFIIAGCAQDDEYVSFLDQLKEHTSTDEMFDQFQYLIDINIIESKKINFLY